jgi:hypothetical protein
MVNPFLLPCSGNEFDGLESSKELGDMTLDLCTGSFGIACLDGLENRFVLAELVRPGGPTSPTCNGDEGDATLKVIRYRTEDRIGTGEVDRAMKAAICEAQFGEITLCFGVRCVSECQLDRRK